MNSTEAEGSGLFDGNMFLYEEPALLNKEEHGDLGLSKVERPFDFAKSIKGVPITAGEVQSAQKHYPVVFSDFENPVLIAIVGITEDVNLFVDESGNWDARSYIPSYLRCHPFAFARRKEDEYAVVIDQSSQAIAESVESTPGVSSCTSSGSHVRPPSVLQLKNTSSSPLRASRNDT